MRDGDQAVKKRKALVHIKIVQSVLKMTAELDERVDTARLHTFFKPKAFTLLYSMTLGSKTVERVNYCG